MLCAPMHACASSLFLLAIAAAPATQPATRQALRLLPDSATGANDAQLKAIEQGTWACRSVRNILGGGYDVLLQIRAAEKASAIRVERTALRFRRFSDPPQRTSDNYDGRIDGPLLIFGDELQTFALVPGRELVLKAIVPIGKRQWYFATLQHFNAGAVRQRYYEYLFDFADDPLTAMQGKLTFHRRLGDELLEFDARFVVTEDKLGRQVAIQRDNATLEKMVFAPGGAYGYLLGPTDRPMIFRPAEQPPTE